MLFCSGIRKSIIISSALVILIITALFCSCVNHKSKNLPAEQEIEEPQIQIPSEPVELSIFRTAYPDVTFSSEWDEAKSDWKIDVSVPDGDAFREYTFFWANGSFLPETELANKEKYWTLLYHYDYLTPLKDPASFSEDEIARLKQFTTAENRKNGSGTPMFFFDAIYDSASRGALEKQIISTTFLGRRINIHKRIKEPLKTVESRILELAKTDPEVQPFLDELKSNEAYYWRIIANTNRKSFHSLGIAIDILPKAYRGKEVFWSWAKDKNPDGWMLTPLKGRWMPPSSVIKVFEEEGFIWGGKWVIWDNMHFEYHPELIEFSKNQ